MRGGGSGLVVGVVGVQFLCSSTRVLAAATGVGRRRTSGGQVSGGLGWGSGLFPGGLFSEHVDYAGKRLSVLWLLEYGNAGGAKSTVEPVEAVSYAHVDQDSEAGKLPFAILTVPYCLPAFGNTLIL